MMGFGSGSSGSPFNEDDDGGECADGAGEGGSTGEDSPDDPASAVEAGSEEPTTPRGEHSTNTDSRGSEQTNSRPRGRETGSDNTPRFSGIDVNGRYEPEELARMLMAREYLDENHQVPYAMWRSGTSTGRDRTTIELNSEVDDLVRAVQREFEARYDAGINKADLREFALVCGLLHMDEVFAMAEDWGLQYND